MLPRERPMPHRPPLSQFDLFAMGRGDAVEVPWPTLPPETRSTVTDLMAQLILDHVKDMAAECPSEENGDAPPRSARTTFTAR
jgi:hypothetical protein